MIDPEKIAAGIRTLTAYLRVVVAHRPPSG